MICCKQSFTDQGLSLPWSASASLGRTKVFFVSWGRSTNSCLPYMAWQAMLQTQLQGRSAESTSRFWKSPAVKMATDVHVGMWLEWSTRISEYFKRHHYFSVTSQLWFSVQSPCVCYSVPCRQSHMPLQSLFICMCERLPHLLICCMHVVIVYACGLGSA